MSGMVVSMCYACGHDGFSAYGGSYLKKEDLVYWANRGELDDPDGIYLRLDEGVKKVQTGIFELTPTIFMVEIENPDCVFKLNDKEVKILRKNATILRGEYDTAAEKLAREYGLVFLHSDMELGKSGDYFERGVDIISLRFNPDGSPYIHQDCRCQGISAGSTGGGEVSFDLPEDFYLTMTAEEIADKCWGSCYDAIMTNGVLATALEKAKARNGFYVDYGSIQGK